MEAPEPKPSPDKSIDTMGVKYSRRAFLRILASLGCSITDNFSWG